jgi:8-oxo-dGTP pyrophosphatase MutT (NUDIX family)
MTGEREPVPGVQPPAFTFTIDPSVSEFNVPMRDYVASHQGIGGIATGAIIFSGPGGPYGSPGNDKLLLVQLASHESMSSLWEVPGGACEWDDETILHSLAREVWEETGLRLRSVLAQVGDRYFFFLRSGLRICKLTFAVEVEVPEDGREPTVKLEPDEHQRFLWVTSQEFSEKRHGEVELKFTTVQQEAAILQGFKQRTNRE